MAIPKPRQSKPKPVEQKNEWQALSIEAKTALIMAGLALVITIGYQAFYQK